MAEILSQLPSEYLMEHSPQAGAALRELRDALVSSGPLDRRTCELIVIAGLATEGFEDSFKVHARRLIALGATPEEMKHAVAVTLGASSVLFQVARAITWIDELSEAAPPDSDPSDARSTADQ
ncbi:carboxymuconolactone decarboxylase family protein [Nocardioides pocheonensis]|uniref:Carboxymuconolactone decarboxylase family protein n=1 Tax=Nocardioides pocheonensis TaxID=661485 RepID=A0A3N0GJ14_9ACTN|nr:carboxymuconolactone decarboxylase family protein [Nocardioides pocheonensis]RNM12196.1 carboxymuconolactone decarboxylase family protein [Nocardioides pocheonensis]